ncbi:MAG: DUF4327 family protein [Geminocystis sp.]|nr:DUF4327 family protein [Geminocystis sp.]MDW8463048.1 DUF4327 family protein [Geminocystis sp.]
MKTIAKNSRGSHTIEMIREEARHLVEKGIVSRHQPIYILCQYIPAREWVKVECELEQCDYLLRDQIGDLIARESWESD